MEGKTADLPPSHPIDFVEAVCPEIQERRPSPAQLNSSQGLYFEEYPPRQKKTDPCITYKLTDGKQINTGYGRTSRPLGYVMEIAPGRWVARVRDLSSGPLPLAAAKKAAIELYKSGEKGEPRDWIDGLNSKMLKVADPRPSVTQRLTDDGLYDVKVKWGPELYAEFLGVEYPEDVAAHQLYDWGHRGTFSMRWAGGGAATFATHRDLGDAAALTFAVDFNAAEDVSEERWRPARRPGGTEGWMGL
jgi:hypothetical protein